MDSELHGLNAGSDRECERLDYFDDVENNRKSSGSIPLKRQELLKWHGWGYKDTKVIVTQRGKLFITSNRYPLVKISQVSQKVREWIQQVWGIDLYEVENIPEPPENPEISNFPGPFLDSEFLDGLLTLQIVYSTDGEDRFFRSHGQAMSDIMNARQYQITRLPDLVVWPNSHEDVVKIVDLSNKCNIVIIPFGGGTNVTSAVTCNPNETRMIVSLDTSQMNQILWLDKRNLTVCVQSGITGQDLEEQLFREGFTTGHDPDSLEFSSVGGWVSTRASGMKKNRYGNIEDLVVHIRFVTAVGVLEKESRGPRISCGIDFNQIILGSEGTLGVITEVCLKVRHLPQLQVYASFVFPDFETGVKFTHDVAMKNIQPASLRLMDNMQFRMGLIMKEEQTFIGEIVDKLKLIALSAIANINEDEMSFAVAVFEGFKDEVAINKVKIEKLVVKYGGVSAGAKNGERGYLLTSTIGYMRDICLNLGMLSDSFETSVPWDRVLQLCQNVKSVVAEESKEKGLKHLSVCCRVTQVYDTGACVYFYFAFNAAGVVDALRVYEQIESRARDEAIACGGNISHHHGVGQKRRKWVPRQISPTAVGLYSAIKKTLDPNNVFAVQNIVLPAEITSSKL
ncbi:alkyldihydroxyacetonephosphate synthase, peroxisomal-like [Cloeon dipterum]|uniref:alkyldihydroxyacetonephosphate synthase, peroxisomal-like n=1 Tax=Cloeon dipterum TaxID=197152 RepID=UPI0032202DF8